ncbi:hypothetical protein Ahy_B02g057506 isoform C [Arachis hypogaea]|uniref:Uncharacterized protein n=1 Tax=Arachis hypogaea TaxID=3818 RepID=A0A445AC25_ARAHY|nr:hypothetical protein Ahy_B02g057506 isoform C [Arachis hypogaea]
MGWAEPGWEKVSKQVRGFRELGHRTHCQSDSLPSTQPSRRPLSSGDWTLLKLQAYSFNFSRTSIELSLITPFHKACSSAATTHRVAAVYWIGTPTVSQL